MLVLSINLALYLVMDNVHATSEASNQKIVAVTGASGFIGAHLCRNLVQHGYTVRACVRNMSPDKTHHLLALNENKDGCGSLSLYEADMMQEGVYNDIFDGVYGVFHVAGNFGTDDRWKEKAKVALHKSHGEKDVNEDDVSIDQEELCYNQGVYDSYVEPLRHLLESVRKSQTVRRVIYTSSQCTGPIISQDNPVYESLHDNPYGKGKEDCERMLYNFGLAHPHILCMSSVPCEVMGPILSPLHDTVYPHRLAGIVVGYWPPGSGWCVADVRDVADTQRRMLEAKSPDLVVQGTRFYNGADRPMTGWQLYRMLKSRFPQMTQNVLKPSEELDEDDGSESDSGGEAEEETPPNDNEIKNSDEHSEASTASSYGESCWATEGTTQWSDPEAILGVSRHAVGDTVQDTLESLLELGILSSSQSQPKQWQLPQYTRRALEQYYKVAEMDGETYEMAWIVANLRRLEAESE